MLLRFDLIKPDHKVEQMRESKSSFSPEEPKSKILRGYCRGQLIPCVQTALGEARPNIWSHMCNPRKKGSGPISEDNQQKKKVILQEEVKSACEKFDCVRGR